MKSFRYLFVVAMLAGLLFIAIGNNAVFAQTDNEPAGLSGVRISLLPEYDDPRLLVIIHGQIEGAEAPAKVRFLVPQAAQMYSAGSIDSQGIYSGRPPDRQPSEISGWDEISYELTSDTFRVEYYDPIIFGYPSKTISFDYHWLYPVSSVDVVVQQPRTGLDLEVKPGGQEVAGSDGFLDDQGLNNLVYSFTDLDMESSLHLDISYYKPDDKLSIDADVTNTGIILAVIGGSIVILSIVGFAWYRIRSAPRTRAERRRAGRSSSRQPAEGKAKSRYCTQCGTPIDGSFKFCPDCGAKLT